MRAVQWDGYWCWTQSINWAISAYLRGSHKALVGLDDAPKFNWHQSALINDLAFVDNTLCRDFGL